MDGYTCVCACRLISHGYACVQFSSLIHSNNTQNKHVYLYPHLERVGPREGDGGGVGDLEQVAGAHARGEEGLVRVAPGGVGDERALVLADCGCGLNCLYWIVGVVVSFD